MGNLLSLLSRDAIGDVFSVKIVQLERSDLPYNTLTTKWAE
jgi:hypothetical protein